MMEKTDFKDYAMEAALLEAQQKRQPHGNPGPNEPFPVLHWMLEQAEKAGISHIVRWSPHGRAFVVHRRDLFVEKVLPVYFNQSKFTSFQRQLSLYGFKRLTKGADRGGYYHPMFLRISRTFTRNIARTKVKNEGPRKAAAPDTEPDFYKMPKLAEAISQADSMSGGRATSADQVSPPQSRVVVSLGEPNQLQQLPPGVLGNPISSAAGSPSGIVRMQATPLAPLQSFASLRELDSGLMLANQLQVQLQNQRESLIRSTATATLPNIPSQPLSIPNLRALNNPGFLYTSGTLGAPCFLPDMIMQASRQNQQATTEDLPTSSHGIDRRTSENRGTGSSISATVAQILRQTDNSPTSQRGNPSHWR